MVKWKSSMKKKEIESFLTSYGDIETWLTKEFKEVTPSKKALNILILVEKDIIVNIIKKGDISDEINKNLIKQGPQTCIEEVAKEETVENYNKNKLIKKISVNKMF